MREHVELDKVARDPLGPCLSAGVARTAVKFGMRVAESPVVIHVRSELHWLVDRAVVAAGVDTDHGPGWAISALFFFSAVTGSMCVHSLSALPICFRGPVGQRVRCVTRRHPLTLSRVYRRPLVAQIWCNYQAWCASR